MTNPIPAATHSFHPTEVVSMAEVRGLVVHLLRVSYPAGTRGDYAHDVPVLAEGADFRVTAHDYGQGVEIQCNCRAFEPGQPCEHTAAALAKVRGVAAA